VRDVEDGLRITEGQLEIPHALQLRRDPLLLLRTFAVASATTCRSRARRAAMIRENLDLIDDAYRAIPRRSRCFFEILRAERRVARTLVR
jgi:UTP:GlnB (protein PII) uridylyltransferase